jgi:hypothetical protein
MAALAARIGPSRSAFVDGRDANDAIMDSSAARLFEVDVNCEVEADVCVKGAGAADEMEGEGGTITIGRGAADDGGCGGCGSGLLGGVLAAIR